MIVKVLLGKKIMFLICPSIFIAFQAAQNVDFGPIGNVISQLGGAAAAVIVVAYFIAYIRDQNKVIDGIRNDNITSQRNYQSSLEDLTRKFSKRQEELQDFFEKQLKTITSGQTEILKETIFTVKAFEKTLYSIKSEIEIVLVKLKPNIHIEAQPRSNENYLTNEVDEKLKKLEIDTEFHEAKE